MILALTITVIRAEDKPADVFGGDTFFDYGYNVTRDPNQAKLPGSTTGIVNYGANASATNSSQDNYGFAFRRIYLTWDHTMNDQIDTRFRLAYNGSGSIASVGSINGTTNAVSYGNIMTYIKDAWIRYRPTKSLEFMAGVIPTLGYTNAEDIWAYVGVEKTISDMRSSGSYGSGAVGPFGASSLPNIRDLGMAMRYKIDDDGKYVVGIEYGNASNLYIEQNVYKRLAANITMKPMENVLAEVYVDQFWQANSITAGTMKNVLTNQNANNIGVTLAYSDGDVNHKKNYCIGLDFWYGMQQNGDTTVAGALQNKNYMGASIFGYYLFIPQLAVVARYDMFNPDTQADNTVVPGSAEDTRSLIILGLDWRIAKWLSVIPNIEMEGYQTYTSSPTVSVSKTAMDARITMWLRW